MTRSGTSEPPTAHRSHLPAAALRRPLRIGTIFLVVSVIWIVLSDLAVFALFESEDTLQLLQTAKGWLWVALATALVIYLANRELRAVRERERTYEELFRNNHAVMLVLDPRDGRIVDANPAAAAFYGYGRNELRSMTIAEINTARDADLQSKLAAADGGDAQYFEFTHRLASGEIREVEVHTGPVELGGERRLFSVIHDVTEKVAARRQLEHAQRMQLVGRLAGGIAHDFNNVLAIIRGSASLATEMVANGSPVRPELEIIEHASERGARLTRQLLTFSRTEVTQPEILDLNEAIREMADGLRRLTGAQIEFVLDLASEPAWVRIDPSHNEQVILNLVVNARDALGGEGTIRIQTHVDRAASTVGLVVEDDGPGIDPDAADNIFEPFFTTKPQGKGTGLGLSTVYSILKRNGGTIGVDQSYEDGARFLVRLPRAEPEEEQSASEAPLAPFPEAPVTRSILLVEDDAPLREVTGRMLERAGYEIRAVATGEEAVEAVRELSADDQPALVVIDLMMPGLSGPETIETLRELGCQAASVFISGYAPEDVGELAGHVEDALFVQKPYSPSELLEAVERRLPVSGGAGEAT